MVIDYTTTDPIAGAFNAADRYTCRMIVGRYHRLAGASVWIPNITLTGNVDCALTYLDSGSAMAGVLIGTALVNADFTAATNKMVRVAFVIGGYTSIIQPPNRMYFLLMTASDAGDRLDTPTLHLNVEESP